MHEICILHMITNIYSITVKNHLVLHVIDRERKFYLYKNAYT